MVRFRLAVAPALLAAAAGCGGGAQYPVRGSVALADGTPVTKGLVVFERQEGGPAVTARGEIRPDGTFRLATDASGADGGVPPGKYRALVSAMDLSDVPDEEKKLPYDPKYLKFTTSGLRFEVKPGENEFPIKLSPPPPDPVPDPAKPADKEKAPPDPGKPPAKEKDKEKAPPPAPGPGKM